MHAISSTNTTATKQPIRRPFFSRSGSLARLGLSTASGIRRSWYRPASYFGEQCASGTIRSFYKPAHHGGIVAWHQDYSYWTRTTPVAHLSCWIGLDDSTRANGCVHYVPGSHRWDLLPITGLANRMDAIDAVLNDGQREQFKPVPIELQKGEASFHHPLMVHGSYANQTSRPRRAAVINVFRDGVVSASDDPLLDGVPPISLGEKITGQFFPLLFERSVKQFVNSFRRNRGSLCYPSD